MSKYLYRPLALILFAVIIVGCSQSSNAPTGNKADIADATLAQAITAGDEAKVRKFLDTNPELVNKVNADGQSPLHYAAKTKNVAIVKLLLAKGADPTVHNDEDETPADIAAASKAGDEIIQLLKGGGQ